MVAQCLDTHNLTVSTYSKVLIVVRVEVAHFSVLLVPIIEFRIQLRVSIIVDRVSDC